MMLFGLVREIHDPHRQGILAAQEFNQTYADRFLVRLNRSMGDRNVRAPSQLGRIKFKILRDGYFFKQGEEFFIMAARPLFALRVCIQSASIKRIEVDAPRGCNSFFRVGLSLAAKTAYPIKGYVNHVESLDVTRRKPCGAGSHKSLKDAVFHPFFCLPTLHPFLGLYREDRPRKHRDDREPFTKTNCRFFCGHSLPVIAKRKIIS